MVTAPQLFARALGAELRDGGFLCFYCGAACDDSFSTRDYVADSFTERNSVAAPGSRFVCGGCVQAMRSDLDTVRMIDGSTQRPKEGATRLLQVRFFSWVIAEGVALAATPAHRDLIHAACVSPPAPPFAICIADGNKHQLFRTPVNYSAGRVAVNCEGTRVDFHPEELIERLHLTMRIIGACGKGGDSLDRLTDPLQDMSVVLQLARVYSDAADLFENWRTVRYDNLTRLAIWLCPGKDDCNARLASAAGEIQR